MPTWILITVSAAFLQNIRSVLQKHLKGALSTTGATFVRFAFGVPFALLYLFGYVWLSGKGLPAFNGPFLFWVVLASGWADRSAVFAGASVFLPQLHGGHGL